MREVSNDLLMHFQMIAMLMNDYNSSDDKEGFIENICNIMNEDSVVKVQPNDIKLFIDNQLELFKNTASVFSDYKIE